LVLPTRRSYLYVRGQGYGRSGGVHGQHLTGKHGTSGQHSRDFERGQNRTPMTRFT